MRPKGTKKNGMKYLTEDALKNFSRVVKKEGSLRDYLLFSLCLRLGLRVQELVNIKLEYINMDSKQLIVHGLKNGRTRSYDLFDENGYRPDRENELWRKLMQWIKKGRRKIDPKGLNPFLFPSKLHPDKSITVDVAKAGFKRYAAQAGIPTDFSIHSLRHTCAITLAKKNWSALRIMGWLRHRSIQSTQIYFEQLQAKQDDAEAGQTFSQYL